MQKKIGDYIISLTEVLGKGTYGQVNLGLHLNSKQKVAIKTISLKTIPEAFKEKFQNMYANEIRNMQLVDSVHIVKLIDIQASSNNLYLICEYCNGGNLEQYLKKKKKLSEKQALKFFYEILEGFKSLYENKIVHRDLKPGNILLNDYSIKVADFGFSKMITQYEQILNSFVGTPQYMSPQILQKREYTSKTDIWSLGMILYQMLYGKVPWEYRNNKIFDLRLKISQQPLRFPEFPKVSENTQKLIRQMLEPQQENRIDWLTLFDYKIAQTQKLETKQNLVSQLRDIKAMGNSNKIEEQENINVKNHSINNTSEFNKKILNLAELYFTYNKIICSFQQCFRNESHNFHFFNDKNDTKPGDTQSKHGISESTLIDECKKIQKIPIIQNISNYFLQRRNKSSYLLHIYFRMLKILQNNFINQNMMFNYTLFFLVKKANKKLHKIYLYLNGEIPNIFNTNQWQYFLESREGQQVKKQCSYDYTMCSCLLKVEISRCNQRYHNINDFNKEKQFLKVNQSLNEKYKDKNLKQLYHSYIKMLIELLKFDLKQLKQQNELKKNFLLKIESTKQIQWQIMKIMALIQQYQNNIEKKKYFDLKNYQFDLFKLYEEIQKKDLKALYKFHNI